MSEVDCPTTVPPGELTVTEDGLGQKDREIHNQKFTCGITEYSKVYLTSLGPLKFGHSPFIFHSISTSIGFLALFCI